MRERKAMISYTASEIRECLHSEKVAEWSHLKATDAHGIPLTLINKLIEVS